MARHAGALTTSGGSRASFVCGWSSRQARGGPAIRAGSAEGRCYSSLDQAFGYASQIGGEVLLLFTGNQSFGYASRIGYCEATLPGLRLDCYSSLEIRPSAMRAGYRVRGVATLHWKSGLRLCEPDRLLAIATLRDPYYSSLEIRPVDCGLSGQSHSRPSPFGVFSTALFLSTWGT